MMDPADVLNPEPDGVDAPREGYYEDVRWHRVALPVRIWFGPPVDPDDDSSTLDRGPRWQMLLGDRLIDPSDEEFEKVWPQCSKTPITREEYGYRIERIAFAKYHGAPSDPWAKKYGKIDLLTAPIPE